MNARPYRSILVQDAQHVATVTLNAPHRRNALSPQMVNELHWALDDAASNEAVRVVILAGAGGAFSSGADLAQITHPQEESELPFKGDYTQLLQRLLALGKPSIARVRGAALGGGLGLLAACDLAIAADGALLGTPEIQRGLWPMQIMALLQRLLPRRKLLEMMLLGDPLPAEEAAAWGLLTRVVPDSQLDATVAELAARLAAAPQEAIRAGLEAFHAHADPSLAEALPSLRGQLQALLATQDAREGLLAFLEKRPPRFQD